MSNKVRTAISVISALQRYYYLKGVMFTNSSSVRRECKRRGIDVIPIYHHNRFGMPYLRHLLLTIRSLYDSRSYGYINSDMVRGQMHQLLLKRLYWIRHVVGANKNRGLPIL